MVTMDVHMVQRIKGVVQIVVPVALGVDTIHSFYKVHRMARERLKVGT